MLKPAGLLGVSILIMGCSHTIPYKYYGLDADSYEGKLLGPTPKDDVLLHICQPDKGDISRCFCMESAEFLKMKQDYIDIKNQLGICQSR